MPSDRGGPHVHRDVEADPAVSGPADGGGSPALPPSGAVRRFPRRLTGGGRGDRLREGGVSQATNTLHTACARSVARGTPPGTALRSDVTRPGSVSARSTLGPSLAVAGVVWLLWLALGGMRAIDSLTHHWPISLTMVFGSLVGGGTSEGGGAVAFPVFTKILSIPAGQARIFTFAIQSIGMSAASLVILRRRVPIEYRALRYAAPPAVVGVALSATLLAPSLSMPDIRIGFTTLLTSLALALLVLERRVGDGRNQRIPVLGRREAALLGLAGFVGGVISGLVGVGENTVAFIALVLLFRVCEKVATPTTVILMTIVSIAGFLTHLLVLRDFTGPLPGYWLAAVPVVVVGAPLGAFVCSMMSRRIIRRVLISLIAAEFVSTLVLIHIPAPTGLVCAGLLIATTAGCYLLTTVPRYDPATPRPSPQARITHRSPAHPQAKRIERPRRTTLQP